MAYEIVMPQLSDSMEEGRLVSWKVKPGDRVKSGDIIAEVESDKAVMDIQSFKEGVIRELKIKEGDTVPVGNVIAVIDTADEEMRNISGPKGTKGERPPEKKEKQQSVSAKKDSRAEVEKSSVLDELFGSKAEHEEPSIVSASQGGNASPKARAVAAKYGIDIEALQKEGRLPVPAHAEDVKKFYLRHYFTPKALEMIERYHLSADLFEREKKYDEEDIKTYISEHEIPLPKSFDSMKKAIASAVTEAAKRPVFHIFDTIDAKLLKEYEKDRLTITVWLIKLFGEAMMRHENFRTTLKGDSLLVWPNASISLAMARSEALYAMVFKDVNRKNLEQIVDRLEHYKIKVEEGKIAPEDLTGSAFGLSNLGMMGIERFDAMINRNDCAIAAVGSEIAGKISITLTIDHRIVNGYQGAEFMQTLKRLAMDRSFFERVKCGN